MSLLSYNGITLPYSQNTHCGQESVSDESNTDLMYTKFDITYRGVIHWAYINTIAPNVFTGAISPTNNPVDIMDYIRKQLLVKRQKLSLTFNGVELIPRIMRTAVPDGGFQNTLDVFTDSRNGPDPISCVVSQLTNTSWMITYHIVAHYWENMYLAGSGHSRNTWTGNPIISHRWAETVGIDQGGYSTYSRHGKVVMRSDNPDAKIIDKYRPNFAMLGVLSGFIRKSSQYRVSPDGLSMEYDIVDFEVFKFPPQTDANIRGIYEAQGKFYISSPKRNNMRHLGVRLALKGAKYQRQDTMIGLAVGIATNKIQENILVLSGRYRGIQESMRLEVDMYNNEVMVESTAICRAGTGRIVGNAMFFLGNVGNHWTWTPGSDNIGVGPAGAPVTFKSPTSFLRGNSALLLIAAAYYDPSLMQTLQSGGQLNPGTDVGRTF